MGTTGTPSPGGCSLRLGGSTNESSNASGAASVACCKSRSFSTCSFHRATATPTVSFFRTSSSRAASSFLTFARSSARRRDCSASSRRRSLSLRRMLSLRRIEWAQKGHIGRRCGRTFRESTHLIESASPAKRFRVAFVETIRDSMAPLQKRRGA